MLLVCGAFVAADAAPSHRAAQLILQVEFSILLKLPKIGDRCRRFGLGRVRTGLRGFQ